MTFKKVFRGYDPEQVDKYIAETALKEQQLRAAQKERIDELSDENYALRQQVKQYQTDEQAISKSLIASQQLAQELKFDAERFSDLALSRAKIFYATWRAYAKTLVASLSDEEVRQFNVLQNKLENIINSYEGKDVAREVDERAPAHIAEAAATDAQTRQTARFAQQPQAQTQAASAQPQTQAEAANPRPTEQPLSQHAENNAATREQTNVPPVANESSLGGEQWQSRAEQPSLQRQDEPPVAMPSAFAEFEKVALQDEPAPAAPLNEEEAWRQARAVVDVTPSETTMSMGSYSNPITRVEQAASQVIDLRELTRTDLSLEDLCAELGLIKKSND